MQAAITGLNLQSRELHLEARPSLRWDWLSLDVGAETNELAGAAMAVKPLDPFLEWCRQLDQPNLRIKGGGAAAVELALALRGRRLKPVLLLRGADGAVQDIGGYRCAAPHSRNRKPQAAARAQGHAEAMGGSLWGARAI